jgi:hypothetical protein
MHLALQIMILLISIRDFFSHLISMIHFLCALKCAQRPKEKTNLKLFAFAMSVIVKSNTGRIYIDGEITPAFKTPIYFGMNANEIYHALQHPRISTLEFRHKISQEEIANMLDELEE